jgi:hypothetical protein
VRAHWVILVLVVIAAFTVPASADDGLHCWTFGQTCGTNGTIVAQSDGDIKGNIFYANANFTDWVRVIDLNPQNSWTSSWMLDNQRGVGQPSVDFGHALKNDILVVQLCDQQEQPNLCVDSSKNQYLFASDPKYSADGLSHAMIPMDGGVGSTAKDPGRGTQLIWLEDLSTKQNSDWDYNDLVLSLHNVDVAFPNSGGGTSQDSPVPEPATLSLLAGGVAAGLIRRFKKS